MCQECSYFRIKGKGSLPAVIVMAAACDARTQVGAPRLPDQHEIKIVVGNAAAVEAIVDGGLVIVVLGRVTITPILSQVRFPTSIPEGRLLILRLLFLFLDFVRVGFIVPAASVISVVDITISKSIVCAVIIVFIALFLT